eukprot:591639-Pelagomonas_calceolata.AAC.2
MSSLTLKFPCSGFSLGEEGCKGLHTARTSRMPFHAHGSYMPGRHELAAPGLVAPGHLGSERESCQRVIGTKP